MTPHRNAEYLRALADGKRVRVEFSDSPDGISHPLEDCSTSVQMSLLSPSAYPQIKDWSFHIEQTEPAP